MTEKIHSTPFILNLTGTLSPEWQSYVQKQNLTVVDAASEQDAITHILVKGNADFFQISFDYKTVEKNIQLIAVEQVLRVDEFTKANGKLVLSASWFKSLLGYFILDKYFQEHAGITLADSFPKFQELGSFNVTNLYNTGEYLDRMIYQAFENGLSALSIKSYFDHLIMYLACLRAEGKLGLPVEVSYGSFEGVFGLQIHFFADKLSLQQVTESLSRPLPINAQDEVLKLALNNSEFFDLTYLYNVKKAVVTALWNKSSEIRATNKGFLLSSLEKSSHLSQFPIEGLADYSATLTEIPDLTPEAEAVTVLKGTEIIKEESTLVSGSKDAAEVINRIAGSKDAPEVINRIAGSKDEPEAKTIVSGSREEKVKEKATIVKGTPAQMEDKSVMTFTHVVEDKGDLSITSLGQEAILQQQIQKLQRQVDAKDELVSKILAEKEKQLALQADKSNKETEHLKSKLITIGNELKVMRETQAKVESVRQEASLALTDEQSDKLLDNNPEKLLKKLRMENQQREILFQKEIEKLQRQNSTRETMLTKLKESMAEVLKKKDQQIDDLLRKAERNLQTPVVSSEFEFRDFPEKKHDDEKVDNANEETVRLYQDASQKNVIFQRTVDQLERETAAKDMMLDKNRENFNIAIEKRDQEIKDLKERLNKQLQEGNKESNTQQLVHLERQNQYLTKMNESYKVKITTLMAEIETLRTPDAKDDAKRLQVMNVQNKNMIESLKRDLQRYQDKAAADLSTITNLRGEKNKLEIDLKKSNLSHKVEKDNGNSEAELKKAQLQIQTLDNQLKESGSKLKDLEAKLADARKSQTTHNNVQDGQAKSKISHLEASIKKLTQDLLESRNQMAEGKKEVNKVRLEKTAIQNELEKLKKDSDKKNAAAAASPKKPNPDGKAA